MIEEIRTNMLCDHCEYQRGINLDKTNTHDMLMKKAKLRTLWSIKRDDQVCYTTKKNILIAIRLYL